MGRRKSDELLQIADALADVVDRISFAPPVRYVYNPLRYARAAYAEYVRRYAGLKAPVILLGMNPGPWGMAQTGVPFGEVGVVRDWLRIPADTPIGKPNPEHPRRQVLGLACSRSEISGQRLWGWARDLFGDPKSFFSRFFVANYCPLAFLEESGRNLTPDRLRAAERSALEDACSTALRELVSALGAQWVIGIGQFAEARARVALADSAVRFGRILHPSPASPQANRNWAAQATGQLRELGVPGLP
jgi:single-strand selective monofunctional uracil DNA glycosylase